jgi:hypothetical protein
MSRLSIFFKYSLLAICLIMIESKSMGQLYFDYSAEKDYYNFEEPLNVRNSQVLFTPKLGLVVYSDTAASFKAALETGFFRRRFYQEFSQEKFKYRFFGLFLNPVASYNLKKNLFIDGGISLAIYAWRLESGRGYSNDLGEGFRGYDIGAMAGLSYYFWDWFCMGSRYTKYFVNMLEYQPIGNFGEFEPARKDIITQRVEIYLRYQIANRLKR